jgi:hypothetical protein
MILTMTYCDCWTLLLGYLKYLLNINFKYIYIMFYSLNWLFWCGFYMWNDKPMGTRYPPEVRRIWIWVQISTRRYEYVYEFLLVASFLMGG